MLALSGGQHARVVREIFVTSSLHCSKNVFGYKNIVLNQQNVFDGMTYPFENSM